MFIGHFAVGFASKKWAPQASLGILLLAPLLLDVLWPLFLALGLESVRIDPGNTRVTPLDLHDYPYSHSLLTSILWSALLAVTYFLWRRDRRVALVLGLGVFSHWLFDFVTHRPDMPLYPGSRTFLGLGLWNSLAGTVAVEGALFAVGVALYSRATRPRNRTGTIAWWALVLVLVVLYVMNLVGPPPPSPRAIIIVGFVGWLFVPWAAWIDRNREIR